MACPGVQPGGQVREANHPASFAVQFCSPIRWPNPAVACNLHLFIRLSIFACGIYNFVERKCRMKKADILVQRYQSPCGELVLGSYGDRLCLCNWTVEMHPGRVDRRLLTLLDTSFQESRTDITDEAVRQLSEYFSGDRKTFDIPLLFVPCHRVIGHARTLTGYGGGLDAKKFLLDLESHSAASVFCRG